MASFRAFVLMHLAPNETSFINAAAASFADQVNLYFDNAALLSATLERQGIGFSFLTNDASLLNTLVKDRRQLAVEQIATHVEGESRLVV
jgi:hypothetical protein